MIYVLNGPNIGRLGTRQPEIYGAETHDDLAALCVKTGEELGLDVVVRQTDAEYEMLGWLHAAADERAPARAMRSRLSVHHGSRPGKTSRAVRPSACATSIPKMRSKAAATCS